MKKFFCIVICAVMLFLAGCGGNETVKHTEKNNSQETKTGSLTLLYCYGDTFDPYTAKTALNRQLCTLIFDPLIKYNEKYEPVFCLAQSAALEGTTCTVVIREALFSDGSQVTADDVVFSYSLARGCATANYGASLYEVVSVSAADSRTVVFKLTRSDPYFLNLLDFPIIKSGTTGRYDSDGMAIPPVGCGRFTVSDTEDSLVKNANYYGNPGNVESISLLHAPDSDSVSHYVEVGATDIYYTDVSDGNIVRMSGKRAEVDLNRLVYIGINSGYGPLSSKEMRYAISSCIDRGDIVSSAYYTVAGAATGFFNPSFADAAPSQTLSSEAQTEISIENLEKIGYNSVDASGYRVNSSGAHPKFTLLVNSENSSRVQAANLIAKQCKAVGIEINVQQKSYAEYHSLISSGNFQLYLGEISVLANMDLSALTVPGGSAAFGVGSPAAQNGAAAAVDMAQIMQSYYSGGISTGDLAAVLLTEMTQIPICYRKGLIFYSSDIANGITGTSHDIYFSVENYTFK